MNKVNLVGRLTKEPEIQYTKSGISCMSESLAVDRGYGENKKTDFIPIVLWRNQAEYINQRANKGSMVSISGLIQSRQYKTQDGQNRTVIEVLVEEIQILDKFKDIQSNLNTQQNNVLQSQQIKKEPAPEVNQQLPQSYKPSVEITDDDLPF